MEHAPSSVCVCPRFYTFIFLDPSFLKIQKKGFKILLRRGRLKGKEKEDDDEIHSPSKQVFVLQRVAGLLLFSCVLGTCRFAPESPPSPKAARSRFLCHGINSLVGLTTPDWVGRRGKHVAERTGRGLGGNNRLISQGVSVTTLLNDA